jgi:hypothetical protein
VAGHCARRLDAPSRADRKRQNARGLSLVPRSPDVLARAANTPPVPRALCLAAQGAGRGRRTQPAGAARGDRTNRRPGRRPVHHSVRLDSHRRYARKRTREIPAGAIRHPHHDARIALPPPDVERTRGADDDSHGDRGRDSRARADQARRASRALARTSDRAVRAAAAADRTLGNAASARGGCAVPRGGGDSHQSSVVSRQSAVISRQSSVASHQSSVGSRPSTVGGRRWEGGQGSSARGGYEGRRASECIGEGRQRPRNRGLRFRVLPGPRRAVPPRHHRGRGRQKSPEAHDRSSRRGSGDSHRPP